MNILSKSFQSFTIFSPLTSLFILGTTRFRLVNPRALNLSITLFPASSLSVAITIELIDLSLLLSKPNKELRLLMSLPESYKNNDIVRLLNKSQKDVSENTDLKFSFEVIKSGKVFDKITFQINKNKKE